MYQDLEHSLRLQKVETTTYGSQETTRLNFTSQRQLRLFLPLGVTLQILW